MLTSKDFKSELKLLTWYIILVREGELVALLFHLSVFLPLGIIGGLIICTFVLFEETLYT